MAVDCHAASRVVLRVIEVVFALICFAPAAWVQNNVVPDPPVRFTVFVGVTGFLIAAFYTVVSCVEGLQRTFWGVVEVVINGIWVVFWLAAAGSLAAYSQCKASDADLKILTNCDKVLASQAFAWMSWLLWIGSLVISFIDWRRGRGVTGGKNYPRGTPQV